MPPHKFKGSLEELQAAVAAAGITGSWSEEAGGKQHSFRSKEEGILNWWPATGTLQCQGKGEPKAALEQVVLELVAGPTRLPVDNPVAPSKPKRQIFIVHGHDPEARDQLELALHRLNLARCRAQTYVSVTIASATGGES